MGRRHRRWRQELKQLCALPQLVAEGIFTHFASADEEDDGGFTEHQFSLFTAVITEAEKVGCHFALRHCCNSAATVRFPQMHLDMVRPGVILYGMAPDRWMQPMLTALQPVMELKTTVSMVKKLAADTPLSYGRTYTTTEVTDVATVPIGYADGYLRACSNRACMLVAGHRVPGAWSRVHGSVHAGCDRHSRCPRGRGGDRLWPGWGSGAFGG